MSKTRKGSVIIDDNLTHTKDAHEYKTDTVT